MKVGESGQITIPRDIRDELGLTPGTEVEICTREGEMVVRPSGDPQARMRAWIDQVRGSAKPGFTTDEIMSLTRGED